MMKDIDIFFEQFSIRLKNFENTSTMENILSYINFKNLDVNNIFHINKINKRIMTECIGFEVIDWEKILPIYSPMEETEKALLKDFFNCFTFFFFENGELAFHHNTYHDKNRDNVLDDLVKNTQKLKPVSSELVIKSMFLSNSKKEKFIAKGLFDLVENKLNELGFKEKFEIEFAKMYLTYLNELLAEGKIFV